MATEEYEPGDVIYLSSGDEREAARKKRPLEDASRSKTPDGHASSAPRPKRLRTGAPSTYAQDSEDSSDEEEKGTRKPSTRQSTSGNLAPKSSGDLPDFKHLDLTFKMPKLAENNGGSWLKRFKDWIKEFHAVNSEICQAITPVLAESAYNQYIDQHAGVKPKKRKNAKQVAKEFESTGELEALLRTLQSSYASGRNQSTLDTWVKRAPEKEPVHKGKRSRGSSVSEGEIEETNENESDSEAEYEPTLNKGERTGKDTKEGPSSATNAPANGDAASHQDLPPIDTHRNVPTGNDALEQQRRYFPSANDPAQMCLLCGLNTHLAISCPTLICSSCGSLEHSDICCPEKERCNKCRQLGHQASQCTEKLALTKEEGLACVFCSSTDHLEEQCTQVWRSFRPDAFTVRKVAFIPASCSMCGSDRHFSSDCNSQRSTLSNPTWSVKNRDQYIDPDCGMAAIEEATAGQQNAKAAKGPDLRIRGHAARTTNVHYSEN
ncbi:uncharacterized protein FTOL_09111 [Fusarium torulosum]|uniref:CCHC-type domain-containing protein n=1 Tax=Fusarium torulosum TaxID=33205 RepID=A0AAE8MDW4_9HYPO|nr:uncharacterized protein FTOL_09111 [Fusarium torulosum]